MSKISIQFYNDREVRVILNEGIITYTNQIKL